MKKKSSFFKKHFAKSKKPFHNQSKKSNLDLRRFKCRKCREWISRDTKHCPNCGLVRPAPRGKRILAMPKAVFFTGIAGLVVGIIGAVIGWSASDIKVINALTNIFTGLGLLAGFAGGAYLSYWDDKHGYGSSKFNTVLNAFLLGFIGMGVCAALGKVLGPFVIFALGAFVGFGGGSLLLGSSIEKLFWGRSTDKCLKFQKKLYRKRLKGLQHRLTEVNEAINLLSKDKEEHRRHRKKEKSDTEDASGERQQKRIETLKMKVDAIEEMRLRYLVRIEKMDLLRWSWGLKAITDSFEDISYEDCKERVIALESLHAKGEEILTKWRADEKMTSVPEGKECLELMESGLHSCDSWLNEMQDKLAELAAKPISKLSPIEPTSSSDDDMNEFAQFVMTSRSSDIFSARDDLEQEYMRLKLDEDSARELD